MIVQLCTFAAFFRITAMLMSSEFRSLFHPALWLLAWFTAGTTTLIVWALSLLPYNAWINAARQGRFGIFCGITAGSIAWAGSFLTSELWRPLASSTFRVVAAVLGFIYSQTLSDPAKLLIGTAKFEVMISPECSGYEGISLMLVFLTAYVWLSRARLRFPRAMLLFPVGVITIWIVNIFRIVALVVIGTSGLPAIARGGFHSQAGWIGFSAVALSLVVVSTRHRYFTIPLQSAPAGTDEADPTAAYLIPFLVIILGDMLTGAFSAGFDMLYALRIVLAGVALWWFRKTYSDIKWSWSWQAILIGVITFIIWIAIIPAAVDETDGWPPALRAMPLIWAALWLLLRIVGYVVTVPIAEELAFRGFLTRRCMRPDFYRLPIGIFSWASFLISSILFGALHGRFWLPGCIAGLLFALALYRRRMLADAVQAHATTNALIAVYVFITGHWSVWS